MVGIGECVLHYSRLLQLPQTTVAAVFTNASMDTVLCSTNEQLATRAINSIHYAQERVSGIFHQSQELMDFPG